MPTLTEQEAKAIAIPLLLGYLINWALFGALAVQVYIYHISFPKDSWTVKLLVHGLFLLEAVQTAVVAADLFKIFGSHFGDSDALTRVQLLWLSAPVLSGITSAIVQLFFAHRINIISRKMWIGIIIAVLAIAQGAAGVAQGIQAARIGVLQGLIKAFASCIVWHAGSAVCDVVIALAMTYYLSSSDKTFISTHDRVKRLTRLIIETGILTAAVAVIDLVLFLVIPNSTYHVTPALTLAKLSSNSLVMIFNSRSRTIVDAETRGGSYSVSHDNEGTDIKFARRSRLQLRSTGGHGREDSIPVDGIKVRKEMWIDTGEIPLENINEMSTPQKSHGLAESV